MDKVGGEIRKAVTGWVGNAPQQINSMRAGDTYLTGLSLNPCSSIVTPNPSSEN